MLIREKLRNDMQSPMCVSILCYAVQCSPSVIVSSLGLKKELAMLVDDSTFISSFYKYLQPHILVQN